VGLCPKGRESGVTAKRQKRGWRANRPNWDAEGQGLEARLCSASLVKCRGESQS